MIQAHDYEICRSLLDILREHPIEPQYDREQRSCSQTLGARGATPCAVAEPKESPDVLKPQSHRTDAVHIAPGTEPRLSGKGRFVCGICGRRFHRSISRDNHEKQHEHGHPHRCPEPGDSKTFGSKNSAMMHAKLVRYPYPHSGHFLTSVCRSVRKRILIAILEMKHLLKTIRAPGKKFHWIDGIGSKI